MNGMTAIKARICAEIPEPFLCHANAKDGEIPEGKEVLCQGWVETCNELAAAGHYKNQSEWQQKFKIVMSDVISDLEVKLEAKEVMGKDAVAWFHRRMQEYMAQP